MGQIFSVKIGRYQFVSSIEWVPTLLIGVLEGHSAPSACTIEYIWRLAGLLSVSLELLRCREVLDMALLPFHISIDRP